MSRDTQQSKQPFSAPLFPGCRCGLLFSAAALLALSACGGGGTVSTGNTDTPPPVSSVATTGDAIAPIDASKIPANAAKPAETQKAVETLAPIPTPMETFRALAPQQGLKITQLFTAPVADESTRIARVENAVQGLRNDFDTIMSTIVRMASMENDMRDLINKLHVITGNTPPERVPVQDNPNEAEGEPMPLTGDLVNPPDRAATETDWSLMDDVATEAPAAAATAPAKTIATGAPSVKAIRVADHADSTRIVLDMTAKASVPPAGFQNDGKQLVLELPGIDWAAKTEAALKNSGLVSGYRYENGKLTLTLSKASQIKAQLALPPEGTGGHRLVLDLKPKT